MGGGYYLLTNRNTTQINNQTLLNEFSKNQQSDNVQVIKNIEFTAVEAGPGNFAIARDTVNGDRVYGWGDNKQGQLGVGDINIKAVPTKVVGLPDKANIKWIKSGANFTLIVLTDNSIWATGINNYGQFGNGSTSSTAITTFTNVQTFKNEILNIDVGSYHAAVVTTNDAGDNVIYSWGRNNYGQLGIGGRDDQLSPSEVKSLTGKQIGKLKLGNSTSFISILGIDNTIESIYAWGNNYDWRLGIEDKISKDVPTLITYSFKGKLTGYYPGVDRIYFTIYDSTVSENYVYVSGRSDYRSLGVDSETKYCSITQVPGIPTSVEVRNIYIYSMGTFFLTSAGDVYSCGYSYLNIHQIVDSKFHETEIHGVTNFFGSVREGSDNVFILANNQLFAWGYASYGGYGNGDKDIVFKTPAKIDPFSATPSSMKQIKTDNKMPVSDMAKLMYDETTGINLPFVNKWVQTVDFPADAVFSMKTAPIVDEVKREISLIISASRSYSAPDGAKTLDVDFPITLTGFKAVPDSNLTIKGNKPWISTFEYENIETELGEGKATNLDNLKKVYDFRSFPDTAEYAISEPNVTFNPSTRIGTYTAKLTASQYYLGDKLLTTGKEIIITMDGFNVKPDSSIAQKPGIDTSKYNLTSIDRVLRPNGVLSETVFKDLFTLADFPANTTFTADKSEIVGANYNISIIASQAWVDGFVKDNVKFEKTITGLNFQPDSVITAKSGIDTNMYNLTNINRKLHPNGVLDSGLFVALFTTTNFPTTTFTSSRGEIINDEYHLYVNSTQSWVDGFNVPNKQFTAVVTGLSYRHDSSVIKLEISDSEVNDIIKTLEAEKEVDRTIIGKLIDLNEFPADAKFIVNKIDNSTDGPSFEFTPDKIYKDGDAVLNDTVTKLTFKVDYYKPPVAPVDNTGLIIGLSIGGILLLLIIIGLVIWYFKRKNKNGNADNQSVLY